MGSSAWTTSGPSTPRVTTPTSTPLARRCRASAAAYVSAPPRTTGGHRLDTMSTRRTSGFESPTARGLAHDGREGVAPPAEVPRERSLTSRVALDRGSVRIGEALSHGPHER